MYNCHVLCYRKGRNRKVGHFKVLPPDVGEYLLKIYAKPEADMSPVPGDNMPLDHVATSPIHVIQVRPSPFRFSTSFSNTPPGMDLW